MPLKLTISYSTLFSLHPEILGEHLKNRRVKLGLYQKDVAAQLRVNVFTLCGWENGKWIPSIRYLPHIIEFLGYDPFPEPQSIGEEIVAARRRLGLSRKRLAKKLGMDEGTLERWEKSITSPTGGHLRRLTEFLENTN